MAVVKETRGETARNRPSERMLREPIVQVLSRVGCCDCTRFEVGRLLLRGVMCMLPEESTGRMAGYQGICKVYILQHIPCAYRATE